MEDHLGGRSVEKVEADFIAVAQGTKASAAQATPDGGQAGFRLRYRNERDPDQCRFRLARPPQQEPRSLLAEAAHADTQRPAIGMANVEAGEDNPVIALVGFPTPPEKDEEFRGFQTPGRTSTG